MEDFIKSIELMHPVKDDVIKITVDMDKIDVDTAGEFAEEVRKIFPDNNIILIPKGLYDVEIDETIQS